MVLKILLILLGVLLLLLCIPIRVVLDYRESFSVRFYFLVFRYTFPSKKPKTGEGKKPKKGKKEERKPSHGGILKGKGVDGFVTLMRDITGVSGRAVRFILRHSDVSILRAEVLVGGEDAARAAIECGYYAAVVYPAISYLSTLTTIRNRQVRIAPDYDADKTAATFHAHGYVWPYIVLWAVCAAFYRYIVLLSKRRENQ